ncbi:MAG: hypothetical protein JKY31_12485 [Rhodobacteraceae bacterium]|nr:hypothetical protein [Paracoccaceae bacterium]
MKVYTFKAKNHRLGQENRDDRPYISYEIDGKYYVWHVAPDGEYLGQVKGFDKNDPTRGGSSETLEPLRGLTLEEFSKKFGFWFSPPLEIYGLQEIDVALGVYSKRVWRLCKFQYKGELTISDISDELVRIDRTAFNQSIVSISGIVRKLKEIFYTIEPSAINNNAYGHELRNLLLLASMEVEAAFRGILSANNYAGDRWTTNDFIKLKEVFALDGWKASFAFYPDYGTIVPFSDWDTNSPTKSLKWYDAYNDTKHDREGEFAKANFENTLNSVCAAV